MKVHFMFLSILLLLVGLCLYLTANLDENHLFIFHNSNEEISQLLNSFQKLQKPQTEINFSNLYGTREQFQVLHPLLDFKTVRLHEDVPSCRILDTNYSEGELKKRSSRLESMPNTVENLTDEYRYKREVLQSFLKNQSLIPESFFSNPPFVDSSGFSYAYFLLQTGVSPYNNKTWIEQHLSFFKTSELRDVLQKYHINNSDFTFVSGLSDTEIEDVIKGMLLVITKDFLLIKNQSRLGFSPLSYWVYDIQKFQEFLRGGKYEISPLTKNSTCLQKIGNICWSYNSTHALGYLYKYSVAFLIFTGLVILGYIGFYLKYLYDKNREQNKNRLSLQVLSHEFRTPVASMLLLLDQLNQEALKFDIKNQDLITRLSAETFRLQRIIEVSKTYLQADNRRIQFNIVELPSVNTWLTDFINETGLRIHSELLEKDQEFFADPFWLKFILSNLIQNAFAHGQEPVAVKVKKVKGVLKFTVEDQGVCEFRTFSQMSEAFVKSNKSKGMGVGLNIIKLIVDEWGGEIKYSTSPTSFTLALHERN